mgnify:CR=1 FL=1
MKSIMTIVVALLLACSRADSEETNQQYRTWAPDSSDVATADFTARDYVWMKLSDQQRTNHFEITITDTNGTILIHDPRPISPQDFTVQSIPYSRYVRHYQGIYRDNRKAILLSYFDKQEFPHQDDIGGMMGGFPHYFTVTIDWDSKSVVEHYAERM